MAPAMNPVFRSANLIRRTAHTFFAQLRLVRPVESRLKSHFVYATVAVLAACQTPPASNQGALRNERHALNGPSVSPSTPYELDSLGPLQPMSSSRFHGGSNRGP